MRAMLSGCGLSNSTLVLTNYRELAGIFLQLVAVAGWLELRETEDRIAEKADRMIVHVGTAAL
jgi:hypothetical protein